MNRRQIQDRKCPFRCLLATEATLRIKRYNCNYKYLVFMTVAAFDKFLIDALKTTSWRMAAQKQIQNCRKHVAQR